MTTVMGTVNFVLLFFVGFNIRDVSISDLLALHVNLVRELLQLGSVLLNVID